MVRITGMPGTTLTKVVMGGVKRMTSMRCMTTKIVTGRIDTKMAYRL